MKKTKNPKRSDDQRKVDERAKDRQAQAARLKERMIAAGYTHTGAQQRLSKDSGVHFQTIGSYYNAKRGMTYPQAEPLAKTLGTTVEYLMSGKGPANVKNSVTKVTQGQSDAGVTIKIPLFQAVDCAYFAKIKKTETFDWAKMITVHDPDLVLGSDHKNAPQPPIFVEMPDGSMEPMIPRGARVLVLPNAPYSEGEVVHAMPPHMKSSVIRQLRIEKRGNEWRKILHPLNEAGGAFRGIELSEQDEGCIIGPARFQFSKL